jgi:hypothetical protein
MAQMYADVLKASRPVYDPWSSNLPGTERRDTVQEVPISHPWIESSRLPKNRGEIKELSISVDEDIFLNSLPLPFVDPFQEDWPYW